MKSDFDETLAQLRLLGGDAIVAGEREVAAGARGDAVDGSDDDLRHLGDLQHDVPTGLQKGTESGDIVLLLQLGHELDIAPGAETATGAGDDNHARSFIIRSG